MGAIPCWLPIRSLAGALVQDKRLQLEQSDGPKQKLQRPPQVPRELTNKMFKTAMVVYVRAHSYCAIWKYFV